MLLRLMDALSPWQRNFRPRVLLKLFSIFLVAGLNDYAFGSEADTYLANHCLRCHNESTQEGSLLDTTISMYGSGMAYGHSHGNANLPIVMAGGKRLGLSHGRHIDLNRANRDFTGYDVGADGQIKTSHYQLCSRPINGDARLSNLLLTVAQQMGVETHRFANSIRPLSEITT